MHLLHFLRTIHFTLDIKLPHNHEAINVHKKAGPLGNGQFFFFTVYSMSLNKMCWFVLFCKGMITFLQHFILLLFFSRKWPLDRKISRIRIRNVVWKHDTFWFYAKKSMQIATFFKYERNEFTELNKKYISTQLWIQTNWELN